MNRLASFFNQYVSEKAAIRMVEHMVLLRFADTTTSAEKQQVAERLMALKAQIPGILDMVAGQNFGARNQGYDIGLTVRFDKRESLAAYGPHPLHQAVFRFMEDVGLQDVIAVDFEI